MATASTHICAICEIRQTSKAAEEWCLNCQEGLCSDCSEHHKLSKSSRDHTSYPISEYQKLPSFITSIKHFCSEHNERFLLYCTSHASPICYKCIKTHNKCSDILPLDEVIETAKNAEHLQRISVMLAELTDNYHKAQEFKQQNLAQIQQQKKNALDDIRNARLKINQHLDKLEQKLLTELQELDTKCTEEFNKTISKLNENHNELRQMQTEAQIIASYASDLQIFLGMKEIEHKAVDFESFLDSILDSKVLNELSIDCTIDTGLQNILTGVNSFGTAQLLVKASGLKISRKIDRQAQIVFSPVSQVRSISDIKLTQERKFKIVSGVARGCCITGKGGLLFTDHSTNKLMVYTMDGSFKDCISLELGYSFDVCLDDSMVVVTSGRSNTHDLKIVDLSTKQKMNSIKLTGNSYGVTCNDTSIICCVQSKNIHVISRSDFTISTIPNTFLPDYTYVTTFNNNIYYTNHTENAIYCCRLDGTPVWQFKDKSVLPCPRGVTTDQYGNVFVADQTAKSIVLVSADGKQHRILGKSDGIAYPTGVFFDKTRNMLLIVSNNNFAYLYSVSPLLKEKL